MSIIPSELSADELFRCNGEYVPVSEIARLTARIAELEKALRDVAEAKMPGLARYIARTTLEASERGGGE